MKRIILISMVFLISHIGFAQEVLEWNPKYKLRLSDFQSSSTQIGGVSIIQLQNGAQMDFSYQMSNLEFALRKNFNSFAKCVFHTDIATIVANDSATANDLVLFAQYQYDLTELYTRKFRKALFEEKGFFSSTSFFQPIYDRINRELSVRMTEANKNMGMDKEKLAELHQDVIEELASFSEYCFRCKAVKRKKKK